MQPRGWVVIIVLFAIVAAIAFAAAYVGTLVRGDYRVASRGDAERTFVDLTDERVVWVEQVQEKPRRGAVVSYDIATSKRTTLDGGNASLEFPVLVDGDLASWVVGDGPYAVRVHDFATGQDLTIGGPADNLTLPGRTLEGRRLLLAGSVNQGPAEVLLVEVRPDDTTQTLRVELVSAPRASGGRPLAWDPARPPSPLVLAGGRAWWWSQTTIAGFALEGPSPAPVETTAPVLSLDSDGARLAWDEDRGRMRRIVVAAIGGAPAEASAFPGDQHGPALNGSRLAYVQGDGLVRLVDLATAEERVLPARTQENLGIRLAPRWASWLSGTLQGHNVMLVPLG